MSAYDPSRTRQPSKNGLVHATDAYLAGILDGEGSVTLRADNCIEVTVTNTDPDLLTPFLRYGGVIRDCKISKLGKKPIQRWTAMGRDAWWALERMRPYLRRLKEKSYQAQIILRHTPGRQMKPTGLQAMWRKRAATKMRQLNGPHTP